MRRIFLLACIVSSTLLQAQHVYLPLDNPNSVNFTIRNFGVKIEGSFTGLSGEIKFDKSQLNTSLINVTLDASSVNTGIDLRDKHLKKEDFFNVEKFKTIQFISSGLKKSASDTWIVTGNLSLKGHTKEVSILFKVDDSSPDHLRFSGEFKINRRDFNVGGRTIGMGDEVIIVLQVATRKKELL